jgi:hypothetical protein
LPKGFWFLRFEGIFRTGKISDGLNEESFPQVGGKGTIGDSWLKKRLRKG